MRHYKIHFEILFFLGILLLMPQINKAQQQSTYKMDFVRAVQFDSAKINHIIAVFKVTPTINDFKLILSMRVYYAIGQGEKIIKIIKQNEKNLQIVVYGNNVEQKNKLIYDLIKEKVNLEIEKNIYLITFDFYDITKKKVNNMSITYGLWESNNQDVRNEKQYDFEVEKLR